MLTNAYCALRILAVVSPRTSFLLKYLNLIFFSEIHFTALVLEYIYWLVLVKKLKSRV